MNGPPAWRLIVDPPAAGAWNMAVDEALLESAVDGGAPATLRLYGFRPAALSLGANQPRVGEADFLRREGIHRVRRPTGGLAVLHEHERTYAVVGALRSATFPGTVLDTYRRIAEALLGALERLGIRADLSGGGDAPAGPRTSGTAACFGLTSAHEIAVAGEKLIGSAQLRRRNAFLQHGSIPLRFDAQRLIRAIGGAIGAPATDLSRAGGRPVRPEELDAALSEAFAGRFGAPLVAGTLTDAERERATLLYSGKYLSAAWTLEGRRALGVGISPRRDPGQPAGGHRSR